MSNPGGGDDVFDIDREISISIVIDVDVAQVSF